MEEKEKAERRSHLLPSRAGQSRLDRNEVGVFIVSDDIYFLSKCRGPGSP